ncbi:polyamine-modulated factor 1-like [Pomacea canaliculata]|uniref:polyamine-modulated factor 1-like n=1 Tax=Pomacea canaliculata TaxID=400727 RepID=UPI000D736175|nr:polyamine-modulated factor 1-like [Pomacea canaliculata]
MSNDGVCYDGDDTKTKPKVLHLSLLQNALSKTTKKCVSSLKFSLLKHHLSAVHARDPVALLKLHEESVSILSSNIQEELALMFKEENICELMKKLDHFQEEIDCTSNVTAWRPSGSPESDICSHLFPVYCKHLQQLENAWHSCSLKIFS